MADYKKMYHLMSNAITDAEYKMQDAVSILQTAQQECLDIFDAEISMSSNGEKQLQER